MYKIIVKIKNENKKTSLRSVHVNAGVKKIESKLHIIKAIIKKNIEPVGIYIFLLNRPCVTKNKVMNKSKTLTMAKSKFSERFRAKLNGIKKYNSIIVFNKIFIVSKINVIILKEYFE